MRTTTLKSQWLYRKCLFDFMSDKFYFWFS
jgi:hypothetical protein